MCPKSIWSNSNISRLKQCSCLYRPYILYLVFHVNLFSDIYFLQMSICGQTTSMGWIKVVKWAMQQSRKGLRGRLVWACDGRRGKTPLCGWWIRLESYWAACRYECLWMLVWIRVYQGKWCTGKVEWRSKITCMWAPFKTACHQGFGAFRSCFSPLNIFSLMRQ